MQLLQDFILHSRLCSLFKEARLMSPKTIREFSFLVLLLCRSKLPGCTRMACAVGFTVFRVSPVRRHGPGAKS